MANPNDRDPAGTWRRWLPAGFALGVAVCTAGALVESYRGQLDWFRFHGYPGWTAAVAPTMLDVFILGGEALILMAVLFPWDTLPQVVGWVFIVGGLAASVAANVGRSWPHSSIPTKLSAAVPPVVLAALAGAGLLVLKRLLCPPVPADPEPEPLFLAALARFRAPVAAGIVPPVREIKAAMAVGSDRAARTRAFLEEVTAALAAPETSDRSEGATHGSTRTSGNGQGPAHP